ncbi:hypothetical protein L6R52_30055 [Myxococcota bacterium]|nr:hypothetical protein [Myxococcota bacterium]
MQPIVQVADDLFDFVLEIDPARTSWERLQATARERCRQLAAEIDAQLEAVTYAKLEAKAEQRLRDALLSAQANLRELHDAIADRPEAQRWRQLYGALARNYEQLAKTISSARLSDRASFRHLTPRNYWRNVFHMASGLAGALLYHFLLSRTAAIVVMAILVVTFTTLEILRRRSSAFNDVLMRSLAIKHIARPHEYYRMNSATFYAYGLLVAVTLFPGQAVEAGCFVLAFGDPAASNVGRRWGTLKLVGQKSLLGTLAFFAAAFVPLFAFQLVFYAEQPLAQSVLVATVGAGVGALAELFTKKLDDNLTVPLAVAAALALVV